MRSLLAIVLFFTIFTIAVNAQELIPATSEDQELFDQQLEKAEAPQKPVKSATATKERKALFGSLVKEEANKLKAADNTARKEMGQKVAEQRRKNPGAADSSAAPGNSSAAKDGKNSAPGLNDSGAPGNRGNKKK